MKCLSIFLLAAGIAVVPGALGAQTPFTGAGIGSIPDGGPNGPLDYGLPREITFQVLGLTGNVVDVEVEFEADHEWVGDLEVVLTDPQSNSHLLFELVGGPTLGFSSELSGAYRFSDSAGTGFWDAAGGTVVPPGVYRTVESGAVVSSNVNTSINAVFAGLTPSEANGTWTLSFRDGDELAVGFVTAATLIITENEGPTISVTENANPVAEDQVISASLNDTIASFGLEFSAADSNAADDVTFTTSVSPAGNISGFNQSEWDATAPANPAGPAQPSSGTIDTAGLITVVITAEDASAVQSTFRFFIDVPVPGNSPPTVSLPLGSAFTGSFATGFEYSSVRNVPLADAVLQFDDADADNIDILGYTGDLPPGVTAPAAATGLPSGSSESFSGTPAARGTYVVTYMITDNNSAPVTFDVTFEIRTNRTGNDGGGGGGCSLGSSTPFGLAVVLGILGAVGVATRRRRGRA